MSTGREVVRQADQTRLLLRLLVLLAVAAGLAALGAGMALGEVGGVAVGLFLWTEAAYVHLTHLAGPDADKRVRRAGADEAGIVVALRPHLPLGLLCAAGGIVVLFGWTAWSAEPTLVRGAATVLALGALLTVPDAIRAVAARERALTVTPEALRYHGWSYDATITWDDLAAVELDSASATRASIRVTVRPGVTPAVELHRWLLWLEPRPGPDHVAVPVTAVDAPWHLLAFCEEMRQLPADRRAGHLSSSGMPMLTGKSPRV